MRIVKHKKDDFVMLSQSALQIYHDADKFGIINLALVDLQPRLLNLKELISHFINHRHEIVVRRTSTA